MTIIKKLLKAIKKLLRKKRRKKNQYNKKRTNRRKNVSKRRPRSKKSSKNVKRKGHKTVIVKSASKTRTSLKRKKPSRKKPLNKRTTNNRKVVAKRPAKPQLSHEPSEPGEYIGDVTHFFSRIKVAVIQIKKGKLRKGDNIVIKGKVSSLKQKILSMQIESVNVTSARKGQLIGLKVNKEVRVGEKLYKL